MARAQFGHKAGNHWVCGKGFGVKAVFLPSPEPFPSSRTANCECSASDCSCMVGVGRAVWHMVLLLCSSSHPQPAAQHPVQRVFEYLLKQRLHSLSGHHSSGSPSQ